MVADGMTGLKCIDKKAVVVESKVPTSKTYSSESRSRSCGRRTLHLLPALLENPTLADDLGRGKIGKRPERRLADMAPRLLVLCMSAQLSFRLHG